MSKAFQVLGGFCSFVLVILGAVVMMAMDLQLISRPLDPNLSAWTTYYVDFKGSPVWFYIGCMILSVGLTYLWSQKRNIH